MSVLPLPAPPNRENDADIPGGPEDQRDLSVRGMLSNNQQGFCKHPPHPSSFPSKRSRARQLGVQRGKDMDADYGERCPPNSPWGACQSVNQEFQLWLSRLRIQYSVREDVGLIPGLGQWIKDLALLQAVTRIWRGCACVGWQLQL